MSFWDMLPVVLLTLFFVTLCTGGIYVNRQQVRERTRIVGLARQLFGDERKLTRWLHKPLDRFGGRTPSQMMCTHHGLKEVERLLTALQEGYF